MRWKKRVKKRPPYDGDSIIVRRFLVIPECLNDSYRWLELVRIRQFYRGFDCSNCTGGYWVDVEFVD